MSSRTQILNKRSKRLDAITLLRRDHVGGIENAGIINVRFARIFVDVGSPGTELEFAL